MPIYYMTNPISFRGHKKIKKQKFNNWLLKYGSNRRYIILIRTCITARSAVFS